MIAEFTPSGRNEDTIYDAFYSLFLCHPMRLWLRADRTFICHSSCARIIVLVASYGTMNQYCNEFIENHMLYEMAY